MSKKTQIINDFRSGELSPDLDARSDLKARSGLKAYYQGCRTLVNAMPIIEGGAMRMPGTYFVKLLGEVQRILTEDGDFIITEDNNYLIAG